MLMMALALPASALTPVTNIRYFVSQDYTRIVIDLGGKTEYSVGRINEPGRIRIFFDLASSLLTKELASRSMQVDAGLLKQIRVGQYDGKTVRVVLDFLEETRLSSFMISNPYRLVIDVMGTGMPAARPSGAPKTTSPATPPPEAPPSKATTPIISPVPVTPPSANSNGTLSMARQLGLGVHLIVIDAGHGGTDPGCMNRSGLQEKKLTLDFAKRLKALVEQNLDCRVVLTREDDRFIPLEERTAISNTLKADLFVSIHINSTKNRNTYGTETYFLNFATDERAIEVAARENAISTKNLGELQTLVQQIALNSKIEESREFASIMQHSLVGNMAKYNKHARSLGVKQAPFYVLIGAQMPAILIETCFMSNSNEEKLLRSPTYRGHLAEAMLDGLKNYISTFNKPVTSASATSRPGMSR